MRSLKTSVERQENHLGGIAHVRFVLIVLIIAVQSIEVSGGPTRFGPLALWPIQIAAISGLFALLGYVLTASGHRHDLRQFLLHRLRSAYPAYAAVILLSFAALGPGFSDQSVSAYFRDGQSWLYLVNLLGIPVLDLPGVFEFNLIRLSVNMVVVLAPAFIVLVMLIAAMRRIGTWFPSLCAGVLIALPILLTAFDIGGLIVLSRGSGIRAAIFESGLAALCGGLAGSLGQQWGGRIRYDRRIQAGAFGLLVLLGVIAARAGVRDLPLVHAVLAIAAAYLAITLAIRFRRTIVPQFVTTALHPAFISAFPIQQMVASAGPAGQGSLANFIVSIAASSLFGVAFAYLTEKALPKPEGYRAHDPAAASPRAMPTLAALRQRAIAIATGAAVGLILAAMVVGVMALTFYALQRPPEGI